MPAAQFGASDLPRNAVAGLPGVDRQFHKSTLMAASVELVMNRHRKPYQAFISRRHKYCLLTLTIESRLPGLPVACRTLLRFGEARYVSSQRPRSSWA